MPRRRARILESNVDVLAAPDDERPPFREVVDGDGVAFDGDELQPRVRSDSVVRERLSNSHLSVRRETNTGVGRCAIEFHGAVT